MNDVEDETSLAVLDVVFVNFADDMYIIGASATSVAYAVTVLQEGLLPAGQVLHPDKCEAAPTRPPGICLGRRGLGGIPPDRESATALAWGESDKQYG